MRMKDFLNDLFALLNKYQKGFFACCVFLTFLVGYKSLPFLFMEKPQIHEVFPSEILEETQFNMDNRITIKGENLKHIIGVYINNVWEPDCDILSSDETMVELVLPVKYYSEPQKLSIQLETRINSDLTSLSSKRTIQILPCDNLLKPVMDAVEPQKLEYDGVLLKDFVVEGSGFTEDSAVLVNGIEQECEQFEDCLTFELPFSMWCNEDEIKIQIVQCYNGYPTPVKSEPYYVRTDRDKLLEYKTSSSLDVTQNKKDDLLYASELYYNSQVMVQYLNLLDNERYIAVFSVKDEASNAITEYVCEGLSALGFKKKLENAWQKSYLAVLDGGVPIYEKLSELQIAFDGEIDDVNIHAMSAGYMAGNFSHIQMNGTEYSLNCRGMNIVVYDKILDKVVDQVCFDLFDKIEVCK